jgi:hypothetical protein
VEHGKSGILGQWHPQHSMRHTTSVMSSWCSTRSTLGERHVRACSVSVACSYVSQKHTASGELEGRLDLPRRRRKAARKAPSSRRSGGAMGKVSSQANAARQAMLQSLASTSIRVMGEKLLAIRSRAS